jgi:hypothetical protein
MIRTSIGCWRVVCRCSERHMIYQPLPAWTSTVEPQHVGVHAGLVDKYQLGGVKQTLLAVPLAARPCDVLALLFSGVQAFLLAGDLMTIQKTPQRGPTGANALLAQRHQNFLQGRVRPLLDNCQNLLRVLLQPRRASAARLRSSTTGIAHPLQPFDRRT